MPRNLPRIHHDRLFHRCRPGRPRLITVKGQRLIHSCPVIIYAGSLVPAAVLEGHRAETVINSAELHLGQIIELMRTAHANGQDVARVHSGDPGLYGAIGEQIRHLRELGIPFQIIPGVTAVAASAALLECELTLPDIAQSVILTRYGDTSPMPPGESLGSLASHQATLAIHLGSSTWPESSRNCARITAATARSPWCTAPPGQIRTGCWAAWTTSCNGCRPRAFDAPH